MAMANTSDAIHVGFTDERCDDKTKDSLPGSEELQRINDELEKEYVFALKKVKCLLQIIPLCRPCLLYTSPSPRDGLLSRMPSSA